MSAGWLDGLVRVNPGRYPRKDAVLTLAHLLRKAQSHQRLRQISGKGSLRDYFAADWEPQGSRVSGGGKRDLLNETQPISRQAYGNLLRLGAQQPHARNAQIAQNLCADTVGQ